MSERAGTSGSGTSDSGTSDSGTSDSGTQVSPQTYGAGPRFGDDLEAPAGDAVPAAPAVVGAPGEHGNWRWRDGPVTPGPTVIFDLDGVLSDAASRQHFIEGRRRDWDAFFEACGDDPLVDEVARLLELLARELRVVLLTGRPVRVQPQTLAWLDRYQLRWDVLIMRYFGDYAAARSLKRQAVAELRAAGFDLRLAFEDDRRNVEMFRSEGVACVYIHSGYYD